MCQHGAYPAGTQSFRGTVCIYIKKKDQILHINHAWSCRNSCKSHSIIGEGLRGVHFSHRMSLVSFRSCNCGLDVHSKRMPRSLINGTPFQKSHEQKKGKHWCFFLSLLCTQDSIATAQSSLSPRFPATFPDIFR